MKAVSAKGSHPVTKADFYSTTLAPINYRGGIQFRAGDAVILIVLFLEIAISMRLLLAN